MKQRIAGQMDGEVITVKKISIVVVLLVSAMTVSSVYAYAGWHRSPQAYREVDINDDGVVNILDVVEIAGRIGGYNKLADIDKDHNLDVCDLKQVQLEFGR